MSEREPTFNKNDVWALARAVREFYPHEIETGRNAWLCCQYCSGRVHWNEPAESIEHDPSCAYVIAADVLTGCPDYSGF